MMNKEVIGGGAGDDATDLNLPRQRETDLNLLRWWCRQGDAMLVAVEGKADGWVVKMMHQADLSSNNDGDTIVVAVG